MLLAVHQGPRARCGLAWLSVTQGRVHLAECTQDELAHWLGRVAPSEVIYSAGVTERFEQQLQVLRQGGATRAESVRNGLAALDAQPDDWVLVHDAARCCLPAEALARLIDELDADPCGGLLALPVADTLKRQDNDSRVAVTVPRDGLWQAQTPQMFRHGLLSQALAISSSADITDEASAIERLGLCPRLVRGDASNFKVTYAQDIRLAAALLSAGQN
jgi:2-C-methyl-D-erythritol 4-phosphate cytidylyltransferase